jgi:DNA-binding IclR family transcriptional regulator
MVEDTERYGQIETGQRMLAVIETLAMEGGAGVTTVADRVDIAKSTAHAHLQTLHEQRYVAKRDEKYYVGLRFLKVGQDAKRPWDEHEFIKQKVEALAEETQLRAQFLIAEHGEAVYVYRSTGRHSVPTDSRVGVRMPLHSTGAGKAILAFWPDELVDEVIDRHGLEKLTDETIDSRTELNHELKQIRDQGYALNDGESWAGVQAIGAPVTTPDGDVLGGLSVSGSAHRFKPEDVTDLVMGAANEIELNLRYE